MGTNQTNAGLRSEETSGAAPRKGQRITYEGRDVGVVSKVEGDICHVLWDKDGITHQFIWRHPDGLNTLHDWPTKPRHSNAHPIFRPILEGIAPSNSYFSAADRDESERQSDRIDMFRREV